MLKRRSARKRGQKGQDTDLDFVPYMAIFGGTALGAFPRENLLLVFILGVTVVFLVTVSKGLELFNREKEVNNRRP